MVAPGLNTSQVGEFRGPPLKVRIRQFVGRSRNVANYLLGKQEMERGVTTFDDDTWYVSYPRSGNTYWRFLTANLTANGVPVDWTNIERLAPDIYVTYDAQLRQLPRPRYIKSHEPYKPNYRRVVLIVRDPRDVAVSCFHMAKRWNAIPLDQTMESFVPDFVAGRVFASYGNWGTYHGSWLGARRDTPDFWVFRYEDMLRDTFSELTRLAQVLNLSVSPEDITRAIENSRPDRLRELEKQQRSKHKLLSLGNESSPYVRAAKTDQWQSVLSPESVQAIENAWGPLMREFGYIT